MKLKTILTPLVAAVALSSAYGASYSVTSSFGPAVADWNSVVNIPTFNSALGTLTGVTVTLTSTLGGAGFIKNDGTQPESYTVSLQGQPPPPFNSHHYTAIPGGAPMDVAAFATSAPLGPIAPGVTIPIPPFNGSVVTGPFGVATAPYVGNGVTTVAFPVNTTSQFAVGGGGSATATIAITATAKVDVTYTYNPPNIPEPKVYGALGAVVCLGLLGYRQYRLKQQA